jgi:predicted nucleic acid-binding protein
MIRSSVAFDSNVLLYLASADITKSTIAEDLLRAGGVVSVQVLNEVVAVARRKFHMDWSEVRELLSPVFSACRIVPVGFETHEGGMLIATRYGFGIYDSVILAAAIQAGCTTLFSEDLQDGQTIAALTIRNPFAAP